MLGFTPIAMQIVGSETPGQLFIASTARTSASHGSPASAAAAHVAARFAAKTGSNALRVGKTPLAAALASSVSAASSTSGTARLIGRIMSAALGPVHSFASTPLAAAAQARALIAGLISIAAPPGLLYTMSSSVSCGFARSAAVTPLAARDPSVMSSAPGLFASTSFSARASAASRGLDMPAFAVALQVIATAAARIRAVRTGVTGLAASAIAATTGWAQPPLSIVLRAASAAMARIGGMIRFPVYLAGSNTNRSPTLANMVVNLHLFQKTRANVSSGAIASGVTPLLSATKTAAYGAATRTGASALGAFLLSALGVRSQPSSAAKMNVLTLTRSSAPLGPINLSMPLRARGMAAAVGKGLIAGASALSAASMVAGRALTGLSGIAHLGAIGRVLAQTRAPTQGATGLAANAMSTVALRASVGGATALGAASRALARIPATMLGTAKLSVKGLAISSSMGPARAAAALVARSASIAVARAASAASIGLRATASAVSRHLAAPAGVTHLLAVTRALGVATATMFASTALAARSRAVAMGAGLRTVVTSLFAATISRATSVAWTAAATRLSAMGAAVSTSRPASFASIIIIYVRSLSRGAGLGRVIGVAAISTSSKTSAAGRGAPTGATPLVGKTVALSAGGPAPTNTAHMSARSQFRFLALPAVTAFPRRALYASAAAISGLAAHFIAWQPVKRYGAAIPSTIYGVVPPKTWRPTVQQLCDFPDVVAGLQAQTVWIDFGSFLPPGVALSGTPTVTVSVYQYSAAQDASPASRLTEGPAIGTALANVGGTAHPNTTIFFQLSDLLANVTYLLTYSCARNDGSDEVAGYNHITARAPS